MGIVENVKEIADVVKTLGNIELYKRITDLEGEIIDLTRANRKLEGEKQDLEEILRRKKIMVFKKPFYRVEGDEHPFCPKCWEVSQAMVHLDGPRRCQAGEFFTCRNCKENYFGYDLRQ